MVYLLIIWFANHWSAEIAGLFSSVILGSCWLWIQFVLTHVFSWSDFENCYFYLFHSSHACQHQVNNSFPCLALLLLFLLVFIRFCIISGILCIWVEYENVIAISARQHLRIGNLIQSWPFDVFLISETVASFRKSRTEWWCDA